MNTSIFPVSEEILLYVTIPRLLNNPKTFKQAHTDTDIHRHACIFIEEITIEICMKYIRKIEHLPKIIRHFPNNHRQMHRAISWREPRVSYSTEFEFKRPGAVGFRRRRNDGIPGQLLTASKSISKWTGAVSEPAWIEGVRGILRRLCPPSPSPRVAARICRTEIPPFIPPGLLLRLCLCLSLSPLPLRRSSLGTTPKVICI